MHCCQARSSGMAALRRNCSMSTSKQVWQVVHLTNGLEEESGRTGMKKRVNQSRPCMGTILDCWRQEGQTVLTGASGRWLVILRQPKKMMKPRRFRIGVPQAVACRVRFSGPLAMRSAETEATSESVRLCIGRCKLHGLHC